MKCPDHNLKLQPIDVGLFNFIMRYECSECGFWFLSLKQLPLTEKLKEHLNLDNVPNDKKEQIEWLNELDGFIGGNPEMFRVTHKERENNVE